MTATGTGRAAPVVTVLLAAALVVAPAGCTTSTAAPPGPASAAPPAPGVEATATAVQLVPDLRGPLDRLRGQDQPIRTCRARSCVPVAEAVAQAARELRRMLTARPDAARFAGPARYAQDLDHSAAEFPAGCAADVPDAVCAVARATFATTVASTADLVEREPLPPA